jgi:hypothetical protein
VSAGHNYSYYAEVHGGLSFEKLFVDSIGTVENFHMVSSAIYVYGRLLDAIVLPKYKVNEQRNESIIECIKYIMEKTMNRIECIEYCYQYAMEFLRNCHVNTWSGFQEFSIIQH